MQFSTDHDNFRQIIESLEEGVFTVNKDWMIVSFNKAAERITGISREHAIGRQCKEVFRTDICESSCILRKTLDSGNPISNMPVCITRYDNKRIHISVNTAVLRNSKGEKIGGVEIFRDLTDYAKLKQALHNQNSFKGIISKNDKMLKYFSILPQIAESGSTVLIEGDTGTGKELFSKAIHNLSPMKDGPFLAVNCSALPDTLIESELFGYKAGAFTDAKTNKPGRFELAKNGTIFLDEIGDISPAVQVRLLRVLQERVFEPLGSTKPVKTNARVIVATNKNLSQLIEEDKFRDDLYYRMNIIKISLPPLKERKEDIPQLTEHFIEKYNIGKHKRILGLSQEAMAALMLHDWPGNIRELENTIEHAFILCNKGIIGLEHLPEQVVPNNHAEKIANEMTLKEAEKYVIQQSLKRNNWKKVKTAKELGIDKNTLRRKIIRLKIEDLPDSA